MRRAHEGLTEKLLAYERRKHSVSTSTVSYSFARWQRSTVRVRSSTELTNQT